MLTNSNDSNDMNTIASDAIHSYIKDGYRIDAKESMIDREKDKDCSFKAVLKKDVGGIECKTAITLSSNVDDKSKYYKYHKVETIGTATWSEETRTFSSSHASKYGDKPNGWKCKCPSATTRLGDYIKLTNKDGVDTVKVKACDSGSDIYNKIVDRKKNLKEASDAKARSDRQDDEVEDYFTKLVSCMFGL